MYSFLKRERMNFAKYACVLLGALVILFGVLFLLKTEKSDIEIYCTNWGISFPDDLSLIFSQADRNNALGDGIRYSVFSVDESDMAYFDSWDVLEDVPTGEIASWLVALEVSKSQWPEFEYALKGKLYCKEDGSKLYVLYAENSRKVYFVQWLM